MKDIRRPALSVLSGLLMAVALIVGPPQAASAAGPRIDLQVLVVTDGGDPVTAVLERLKTEGVPYRTVDLRDSGRPVIDEAFLSDTVDGVPRAKYQGVVLPNSAPFREAAEMTALATFEKRFGIRQLDAYVYPTAAVGMSAPDYSGALDGVTAQLSGVARADAFRYLRGPVRFDDANPRTTEAYGFAANPLPDDPAAGKSFQPYLTATVGGKSGALAGVYTHDGRSEMVLNFSSASRQWLFQTIGHGLVTWLTKGVHLGYNRNFLGVHVDDVFLPNSRWSIKHNCTPEGDCPGDVKTPDIRMAPEDVGVAAEWQIRQRFSFDLAFNGAGSVEAVKEEGEDPLTDAFVEIEDVFRWVNHTYSHAFLGCVQNLKVIPWQCRKDSDGEIAYVDEDAIRHEISENLTWAEDAGITVKAHDEVVTGEHSGLRMPPQQPDDNPHLAPALAEEGVKYMASDASYEKEPRQVGSVRTVPRYPLNVYYNAAKEAEEVDEYNWFYTRKSDGGSGMCESNPSTCIEPLDPATGYKSHIVPEVARLILSHVAGNDPRPHYAHQSNLTEDRILYPVLDSVLTEYRSAFAANTPLVNTTQSALGAELRRQFAWRAALQGGGLAKSEVTAYTQDGKITVRAPSGVTVPITAPEGTQVAPGDKPFGGAYSGERSEYRSGNVTLALPGA